MGIVKKGCYFTFIKKALFLLREGARNIVVSCLGLFFFVLLSQSAQAAIAKEGHYALVIGNGTYLNKKNRLPNAVQDARAMAQSFREAGFKVIYGEDLDWAGTHRVINKFFALSSKMKVAAFFYAGHAVQIHDANYLITVDAKLDSGENMVKGLWSMQPLFEDIARQSETGLLLLDSCRDNPFLKQVQASVKSNPESIVRSISIIDNQSSIANRVFSQSRGLMITGVQNYNQVELVTEKHQTSVPPRKLSVSELRIGKGLARTNVKGNMLIAYATQPGDVARDGVAGHSPFTEAILKYIKVADLSIEPMFMKVRQYVFKATNQSQRPWVSSSLVDDFYFYPKKAKIIQASLGSPIDEEGAGTSDREGYFSEPVTPPVQNKKIHSPIKNKSNQTSRARDNSKKRKTIRKRSKRKARKKQAPVRAERSKRKSRASSRTQRAKPRIVKRKRVTKRKRITPKARRAKRKKYSPKPRKRVVKKRRVTKVKTASRRRRSTGGSPTSSGFIGF